MDFGRSPEEREESRDQTTLLQINRIVSELYSEVEQVKSREADVRWRRDGGLTPTIRERRVDQTQETLIYSCSRKKIEIPDSTCEKVDIQMNQSKFFETEFEDIEYCDAYDMEAALRSLPSYIEKEDSFLQIRGKQVRCAESPKHDQKEEILFEHGQVEEIFLQSIDRTI